MNTNESININEKNILKDNSSQDELKTRSKSRKSDEIKLCKTSSQTAKRSASTYWNTDKITEEKSIIQVYIEKGLDHKEKANFLFRGNNVPEALLEYTKAYEMFSENKDIILKKTNIEGIKTECLINIATCYLYLKKFQKALDIVEKVKFHIKRF